MSKKETTYKQILLFNKVGNEYIENNKDKETKLILSVKSVLKQIRKDELIDSYKERINDNNLSCCSVDSENNIKKDTNGHLMFTPENQIKANKKNKEVLLDTVVIHTRILPENNEEAANLTEIQTEVFSGLVIDEIKD